MKTKITGAAFAIAFACALPAHSQVKPDVLVKQRQSAMVLQGKYFGPLASMAQGKAPFDHAVVARNASYLDALSKMAWDGFVPATKDVKSQALPAVYTESAKFKEAQDRFQSEVSKLVQVSKGSDENAIKQQITATSKACAACHDNFREKR
jgi:cytochrome c556